MVQNFTLEELINAYKTKYNIQSDTELLKYLLDFHEADLESDRVLQLPDNEIINWEIIKHKIKISVSDYIKNSH